MCAEPITQGRAGRLGLHDRTRGGRAGALEKPGTRQGYHGVTYAWTVGQIVRLVSGMPLGRVLPRDMWQRRSGSISISACPESEEPRVAPMIAADPARGRTSPRTSSARRRREPGSLPNLFLTNLGGADFNSREIHAAEIGSANGITNARGLRACMRRWPNWRR